MPSGAQELPLPQISKKSFIHSISALGSVQALVIDNEVLFAGLQGGCIAVYSLETYDLLSTVHAHDESVLSLTLSEDSSLLISTGADATVHVWSTSSLDHLYAIHSSHEIGDVFCATYSHRHRTVLYGAQNGSISWYRIDDQNPVTKHSSVSAATRHRFFDSRGPGGSQHPLQLTSGLPDPTRATAHVVTVSSTAYKSYAHKSYVYSMILTKGLFQHDQEEEVLISGGGGGTIHLWRLSDLQSGNIQPILHFKNRGASVLSLSCSASFLYAGLANGSAHIYNLASCQLLQKIHVGSGEVTQIQAYPKLLLCGTSEGWVKQFNTQFIEVDSWQAHNGKILATATTSGNDCRFVTGGNDNRIILWDTSQQSLQSPKEAQQKDDDLLDALRRLVAYRTVPSNPRYTTDCHEAVAYLRKLCSSFGAVTSLLSPGEGISPILLAKFSASEERIDTKTVLFYGHYDVVDADFKNGRETALWKSNPFSLHPQDGFLYGRGVTDDKGPILAAIFAIAELLKQKRLACNVTLLLEGDEEAGSRGFRQTVRAHRADIEPVDHVLLSNSYWLDDHIPCLTFGMRGVVHARISITNNRPDLHSGMDGKAVQHEPLKDLTVVLGALIGDSGTEISIPDFYDSVDTLTEDEQRAYGALTEALLPGHPEIRRPKEFAQSLLQRWRYPNLTVHQIEVPKAKTAVTISGTANAALSIRIVPSQTADEIAEALKNFLESTFAKLNSKNKLTVSITSKADPWLGQVGSQLFVKLKQAILDVWSPSAVQVGRSFPSTDTSSSNIIEAPIVARPPHRRASSLASHGTFTADNTPREALFIREGGSIPAISFLEHFFQASAAMFPMGQASDNAHLDNERIRVENLYNGKEVLKRVFSDL